MGRVQLLGKSEPDLVGVNALNEYVVMEAKGRTNGFLRKTLENAKMQTRQLSLINGCSPVLRVAVLSYFDPQLAIEVEDPEGLDDSRESLNFSLEMALRGYYSNFPTNGQCMNLSGKDFMIHEFREIGVKVGLIKEVVEKLKNPNDELFPKSFDVKNLVHEGYRFYKDGFVIAVGERWSDENMKLDPTLRGMN